jgi:hypothetical protein
MAESYPTFRSGQNPTGELLESMLPKVARKTSDTSRTNSTVTADPELQFSVVANGVYIWDAFLIYDGHIDGDINIDFTVPAGSSGEWGGMGAGRPVTGASATPTLRIDTAGTSGYMVRTETSDVATARSYGCLGTGTTLSLIFMGMLRVGSTAGTFSLDWAQQATLATATTMFTDSWIRLQRIA